MSISIMSESEYAQQRRAETLTPTEREIIEKTAETPAFISSVNAEVEEYMPFFAEDAEDAEITEMIAAMGVNR
jgi:hypothetical protein